MQLARLEGGLPKDERLQPAQSDFTLPMLLPFPRHSLLLLKAAGEGRARAVRAIQAIMLRMLTALPPGKVRFTIFDPVGLGENFSAFMHLADFDDQLVASRIWTESGHIEQRLADLTDHMENVIQVYLRNEFRSIEEYNRSAGEMAEPYRVLVVADFPANFSEAAAHRLKSIVASGARCGVFVLMSVDTKTAAAASLSLGRSGGRRRWRSPGATAVSPGEHPRLWPSAARARRAAAGRALHRNGPRRGPPGQGQPAASRSPSACIAPEPAEWWTADSRGGLDVPLGRAGAMKLQHLDLGKGTSQHVLISGKTGSGKSTLLHVLITNLALRYSPDEIELYLVDFKKGVEFKAYARCALPHARVIAIESEREFGLSVLQHLDAELRAAAICSATWACRTSKATARPSPRRGCRASCSIVDEFQELFVDDDRIAQEAALLLDRLVRQGRAFGIHVLLGSQTLGGAYSLARSTIGQMAVRIALQCSESDAHLILSEENTAARLLTRPGEAIYNDANGVYEGNHPFQVVWLADAERDDYLRASPNTRPRTDTPPSRPSSSRATCSPTRATTSPCTSCLPRRAGRKRGRAAQGMARLGGRHQRAHPRQVSCARAAATCCLLGHREEAALGVMAACLMSLAAQHAARRSRRRRAGSRASMSSTARGPTPRRSASGSVWRRCVPHADQDRRPAQAPSCSRNSPPNWPARQSKRARPVAAALSVRSTTWAASAICARRTISVSALPTTASRPVRPSSSPPSCGKARRWGIHTLMWCDTYSTLNRLLDRQSLRNFEMRVLFQMNATDSSNLMDSPRRQPAWACIARSSTTKPKAAWRSSAPTACRQRIGWSGSAASCTAQRLIEPCAGVGPFIFPPAVWRCRSNLPNGSRAAAAAGGAQTIRGSPASHRPQRPPADARPAAVQIVPAACGPGAGSSPNGRGIHHRRKSQRSCGTAGPAGRVSSRCNWRHAADRGRSLREGIRAVRRRPPPGQSTSRA